MHQFFQNFLWWYAICRSQMTEEKVRRQAKQKEGGGRQKPANQRSDAATAVETFPTWRTWFCAAHSADQRCRLRPCASGLIRLFTFCQLLNAYTFLLCFSFLCHCVWTVYLSCFVVMSLWLFTRWVFFWFIRWLTW